MVCVQGRRRETLTSPSLGQKGTGFPFSGRNGHARAVGRGERNMTKFLLGLVSGMILLLLGQWITNAYKRKDTREALISDVAEKYHYLRGTTGGTDGLLRSGVLRLQNAQEIEASIERIKQFGHPDPLGSDRAQLAHKDIHHFFVVLRDNKLSPIRVVDLKTAYQLTKDK